MVPTTLNTYAVYVGQTETFPCAASRCHLNRESRQCAVVISSRAACRSSPLSQGFPETQARATVPRGSDHWAPSPAVGAIPQSSLACPNPDTFEKYKPVIVQNENEMCLIFLHDAEVLLALRVCSDRTEGTRNAKGLTVPALSHHGNRHKSLLH